MDKMRINISSLRIEVSVLILVSEAENVTQFSVKLQDLVRNRDGNIQPTTAFFGVCQMV